jgi:ferredoxin
MNGEAEVHIAVDVARCCGAGHCVRLAPEVFDQDARDGTVMLLRSEAARALETRLREAADLCPTRAIVITA